MSNIAISPSENKNEFSTQPLSGPCAELAEATFAAFRPYINVFDCGIKVVTPRRENPASHHIIFEEGPIHLISKLDWDLHKEWKAQKAAGQKPCVFFPDGRRFNPFLEVTSRILGPKHCQDALQGRETYYYTSGKESLGIIYNDGDAHFDFQTDGVRASEIVRAVFPMAFHHDSTRGFNELLKVYHGGLVSQFNKLCERLQAAMRRVFNGAHILCDVETKGTITGFEQDENGHKFHKSGSLAKLPWNKRWTHDMLAQWKACETLHIDQLERIVVGLEKNHDDLEWAAHREGLKAAETLAKNPAAKLGPRPTPTKPTGVVASVTDDHDESPVTALPASPLTPTSLTSFEAANANPDRLKATIDIARLLTQHLKRIPTCDELLAFLKTNNYFTGSWEQTASKRRDRCKYVLRAYVEAHFDPAKLKAQSPFTINLDRWNNWVKQFPVAWVETYERKGQIVRRHVTREDARVYQAICWTLLKEFPNADSSIPYAWIMAAWQELFKAGKTTALPTQDKIGALRAIFHARGIVLITDPNYSPALHKAIRYALGPNAPGQSEYWITKSEAKETVVSAPLDSQINHSQHITHITISRHDSQLDSRCRPRLVREVDTS